MVFREERAVLVIDESQQIAQERHAHRATIRDVGEKSSNSDNADSSSDGEHGQDEIDDQIVQEIENWKAEAQERRLQALAPQSRWIRGCSTQSGMRC